MTTSTFLVIGVLGAVWAVTLTMLALQPTTDRFHAVQRRLEALVGVHPLLDRAELSQPLLQRVTEPFVKAVGSFLVRRQRASDLRQLRSQLAQVGWQMTPEVFYTLRLSTVVIGMVLGAALIEVGAPPTSYLEALACLWLGSSLVPVILRSRLRRRAQTMRRELPGVLDILTVGMEAGLSLDAALAHVCEADPGPLGREVYVALDEIRLGRPRMDALAAMAERNDLDDLTAVIQAVVQAEPLGVGIARIFRLQAEEMRRLRRQRAQEQGQKAPIKMLLPMLGCIFPTIFVMLLGPAVITVIHAAGGAP